MQIEVLMFAAAREAAGSDTIQVDVNHNATAGDVVAAIGNLLPELASLLPSCRLAIDNRYVVNESAVSPGCEVALIPPVSGG